MGSLDIRCVVVKPTLQAAVEFTAGSSQAVSYVATFTPTTGTAATVSGTSTLLQTSTPLRYGVTYSVAITEVRANPADNVTGAATSVSTAITATRSMILRQRIYDLLAATTTTSIDGRTLRLIGDRYGRPRVRANDEVCGLTPPIIEIGPALLAASQTESGVRRSEEYTVDIAISDAAADPDDAVDSLVVLLDKVRAVVDASTGLGVLPALIDRGWRWGSATIDAGEELVTLTTQLTVPVQADVAVVTPYAR